MRPHLFISDLHLGPGQPETVALFLAFLRGPARGADALYILGDLFDAWIGDDYREAPIPQIQAALRACSDGGTRLLLMHGNRDFLIGEEFAAITGCELLADPSRVELADGPALLMHGDLLCSDDLAYQQARRQLRDPATIRHLLSLPVNERLALAADYRRRSGEATSLAAAEIMDVNQQTLEETMRRHRVTRLIHGHTHRPGHHRFTLDGRPAERWVLPQWEGGRGGYLAATGDGLRAEPFPARAEENR